MRRTATAVCFIATLCAVPIASAQARRRPPLQIVTPALPAPVAGEKYDVQLRAIGGHPPYLWTLQGGKSLPSGLTLDPILGKITGTPASSDEFSVLVQVADSAEPPLTHSKLLVAQSGAPLTVRWTVRPHIVANNIAGAVRVANGSHDTVDMTVIVMAVNENGRATALRYEHLNLPPGKETPDLSFDVSLPVGQYVAHVDATGEVPEKKAIYRDRHEVEGLVVTSQ
jgi:putative Ig domain-containing protein